MKESEKMGKYLDLAREVKKAVEYEGDNDTICSWSAWNDLQRDWGNWKLEEESRPYIPKHC